MARAVGGAIALVAFWVGFPANAADVHIGGDCLGNQNAIERVFVDTREAAGPLAVSDRDRQLAETLCGDKTGNIGSKEGRLR